MNQRFHPYVINALLIGSLGSCVTMCFFWILTERVITTICIGLLPLLLALISLLRFRGHGKRTDDDVDDRDDLVV